MHGGIHHIVRAQLSSDVLIPIADIDFHCISGRGIDAVCAVTVIFTISLEIYTHLKYRKIWKDVDYDGPTQGFSTVLVLRLLGFTSLQLFYLL